MTKKEKQMAELLERALYDLKEHNNEYDHRTKPELIEAIEAILKDTK